MRLHIYSLLLVVFISCNGNSKSVQTPSENGINNIDYRNNETSNNYYKNPEYKYEYRTGGSGNYEYNYDISGSDQDGNSVSGNIDINGKYGSGYIEDQDGNEKYIDVEWVDYGELEGTDEEGNTYEFEVD